MSRSLIVGLLTTATLLVTTASDAHAQGTRFRVDWLFLKRDSDTSSQTLISGPDTFTSSADFNYESGYRLFFSTGTEEFDVEAQFSHLQDWEDVKTQTLTAPLFFDTEVNNMLSPPSNVLAFTNTLFNAAEFNGGMALDETTEGELLDVMSRAAYIVETEYDDFEIDIKTSRLNWWRVGLGYRHIQFDERNGVFILGTFLALDADDAAAPGDAGNDPNDILSDEALTAAGLTSVGGGGFNHGESLLLNFGSSNENELHGLQFTFDGTLVDGEFFVLDIFGNLGVYHNQITARLTETYTASGAATPNYIASYRDRENDLAWATQAGFRGAVKLTDNIQFQMGYELLFIDGLALGPNQTSANVLGVIPISSDSSAFIHGGRVGLATTW